MARQRFIHPEIWTDEKFARLKPVERLFFIGLFSNCDDEGRISASPAYLRSIIFPFDRIGLKKVKQIRDAVVANFDSILLYSVNGNEYLQIKSFGKYQKPRYPRPSRIPAPQGVEGSCQKMFAEISPQKSGKAAAGPPQAFGTGRGSGLGIDRGLGCGCGCGHAGEGCGEGSAGPDHHDHENPAVAVKAAARGESYGADRVAKGGGEPVEAERGDLTFTRPAHRPPETNPEETSGPERAAQGAGGPGRDGPGRPARTRDPRDLSAPGQQELRDDPRAEFRRALEAYLARTRDPPGGRPPGGLTAAGAVLASAPRGPSG